MTRKRITVWICQPTDRSFFQLQWHDLETGRRRTCSSKTDDPQEADRARAYLEYALNNGLPYALPTAPKRIVVWIIRSNDRGNLMLQWHDAATGKRTTRSAGTADEAEAEVKRSALEAELNAGVPRLVGKTKPVFLVNDSELAAIEEMVRQEAGSATRVYFVRQLPNGPIKIGTAADPEKRLLSIRTATAVSVDLLGYMPGGRALEKAIHQVFRQSRIRGEWFRQSPALTRFIREHVPAYMLP
jgi:hypothetical protein